MITKPFNLRKVEISGESFISASDVVNMLSFVEVEEFQQYIVSLLPAEQKSKV